MKTASVLLLAALLAAPALADEVEVTPPGGPRLRVHLAGPADGPAVLLLHGLAASGATNWTIPGVTGALARAGYRVVVPDQRGHGRSGSPRDGAYGRALVGDAVAVLDQLEIERAHVCGYSMGGLVALALAAEHPGRVRSVLLGGMGWLEAGGPGQRALGATLGRLGRRGPTGCAAQLADLALDRDALARVTAPVSIVVGELDPCRLLVRPLERARPGWPVTLVPRAGHVVCVLAPAFREAVLAHLERQRRL
jgi:pimeloyl-ACP methyl ester carboxylesterase